MNPEDIDKLFKEKLERLPAAPSADAWARLQQKMEPPKKRENTWLLYVAASVSVLLIMGLLYFNKLVKPETTLVARNNPPEQVSTASPEIIEQPAVIAQNNILQDQVNEEDAAPMAALAHDIDNPESTVVAATQKRLVPDKNKAKYYGSDNKANELVNLNQSSPISEAVATIAAEESAVNIIEVIIKRDGSSENEYGNSAEELQPNSKKSLLKAIYKQARNLKNGERVELAALGVNTEKMNAEGKNIKEKISKVISL
ncbi:hypothetical protein [Adhaeribacter aquaticus]|uniref:hypothetical protein n=1 Tax=Adhaeribacter aquaticus TaxID=299567 RepID=UPI000418F4F4|nr:hypothetical protein [Adhaeribacter aquaticus]